MVETWEVSPDGSVTTIKLFEGATFSDGTPADAQAAADYIGYFAGNPDLAAWFGTTLFLDTAEVIDDVTLKLTFVEPIGRSFVANDGIFMSLGSYEVWKDVVGAEAFMVDFFPPLGTGPYTIKEYVSGSHLIYEARPEYHHGKPPIDTIVQVVYANVESLVSAFLGIDNG